MSTDKKIREILGKEMPLPESTERRLAETYDIIRARAAEAERKKRAGARRLSRRAAIALAAAMLFLLCACSAVGYVMCRGDFLSAIWRSEEARKNSAAVAEHITSVGVSYDLLGYTICLEGYMTDENGMGYVRYSVSSPDGLPPMRDAMRDGGEYISGDTEAWFETDDNGIYLLGSVIKSDDSSAMNHTVIDGALSGDKKAYFTDVFTLPGEAEELVFEFAALDENGGRHTVRIPLSGGSVLPSVELSDASGGVRAELSAIGLLLTGPDFDLYSVGRLELVYADGGLSLTQEDGACRYAAVSSERWCCVFDRAIVPEEVLCVIVDGMTLTPGLAEAVAPDPLCAPAAARYYIPPPDRSGLELESLQENPFHYRRTDGVEVFCLTGDTLAGCTQEDMTAYKCYTHDCLTEQELAELCPGYEDNYYFSREFYMKSYSLSPASDDLAPDAVADRYLEYIAEISPEARAEVGTVVMRLYQYADGSAVVWIIYSDTDFLWEAELCPETGELLNRKV